MTPGSALRSFAITLAIAITIVGPRASGFTIHRAQSTPISPSTDLSTPESNQPHLEDEIRRPNDTTSSNDDTDKTIKFNETDTATENTSKAPEVKTEKTSDKRRSETRIQSTTENTKIPTISSDTVEVLDSVEDFKVYNKKKETKPNNGEIMSLQVPEPKLDEKSLEIEQISLNSVKTQTTMEPVTTEGLIGTEPDKAEDYSLTKASQSISNNEKTTQIYDTTESFTTEIATKAPREKSMTETEDEKTESYATTTDLPQTLKESSFSVDSTSEQSVPLNHFDSDISTTEEENTKTTESLAEKYQKYTTIVRQRTTTSDEVTTSSITQGDGMKAETSNTQVNFEKALYNTPIPSLEKLRADLLSNVHSPTYSNDISLGTEKVTREIKLTTPIEKSEPKKLETVETKRAGFLDNSAKVTTPMIASVSEETKVTEPFGATEDNVHTLSPEEKKVSGSESQSQLAEDALQEEFLKEEAFNNHKENAIKYHEERTEIDLVKLDGPGAEDSLSVQPIERTKTTLYTPSPNYKPMKKIDVQPAKLFVRDPDDNSWRNESISSLGIVFKPKNSSKSFKEVLKNKTQSELNNLIERTKEDVPDLRVRLEKIAEVRKTKKKKTNKDGEVVYTDYEENSAETSSTTKPEPILNSAEVGNMLTTANTADSFPAKIELEITTPLTTLNDMGGSKEKVTKTAFDIFNRLSLEALTTQKPRKFFNIADYYDTTDEYDADYVTMSKLDLKKFTVPPRTSRPAPFSTKPLEPYVPERRPTVQYFPPRRPAAAPVNFNNSDKDFERKINMFTYKEPPKLEPQPPFVTVPPLPVATEKPEAEMRPLLPMRPPGAHPDPPGPQREPRPDIRPTVKPKDFMYPPADLNENFYFTNSPTTTESEAFLIDSGRLDRGSYIIKHYKDFLNAAVDDGDKNADFIPYHTTEAPRDVLTTEADKPAFKSGDDEDDYDARFRKEVLTRFVDNFNQNSERFKVDFPILYNNSVVHRKGTAAPASSRTFLKRLYEGVVTKAGGLPRKPCEPHCELTVELSPAYELHYYVPNQEEREEQQPRSPPPAPPLQPLPPHAPHAPYRYGL